MQIKQADATSPTYSANDWKAILEYNLFGDPSLSLFGKDPLLKSDVVFLLDGSGSMVSPETGKWQAAVDAAVLFYDLMNVLRYPAFNDRYNSVVFRWLIPGSTDGTTTVPAATGMKSVAVALTAASLNPTFTPDPPYMTPMGRGLEVASEQFTPGTEDDLYTDHLIVLLSDGKHNVGTDPMDVILAPDWPGYIRVYSVGLGGADIEPETIEEIATSSYGEYRISPSPREIEGFFCEILCDLSWKLQVVTVVPSDTDSDGTDDTATAAIDHNMAVFIVVWDDPSVTMTFDLALPDASTATPSSPGPYCTYHPAASGATHAFYTCDAIPDALLGDWQVTNIHDGSGSVPLSDVLVKVIIDPQTIAEFEIENIDHYTGQPILLTAKITEDRKAKLGLTDVYAELIRHPGQSAGTLMATNAPGPGSAARAAGDVTPRSHYLSEVMKALNIDDLSATGGPRVMLNDDGVGGDAVAGDGVYSGYFAETRLEGSYTFTFRARGTNETGVTFDRTETLSKYVKFRPNVQATEIAILETTVDADRDMAASSIRVVPKDSFGSYLGPFRGDLIHVWSPQGKVKPEFQDNMDGSYTFVLEHSPDVVPTASISVGDVIVAHQLDVRPGRGIDLKTLLIILLILAVVIIVLLLRRYLR